MREKERERREEGNNKSERKGDERPPHPLPISLHLVLLRYIWYSLIFKLMLLLNLKSLKFIINLIRLVTILITNKPRAHKTNVS